MNSRTPPSADGCHARFRETAAEAPRLRHHAAGPGLCGQQVPGQGVFGLRQDGFHHRLGQRTGRLPARSDECVLVQAEHPGHTYLQGRFAESDSRPCPDRALCTSSTTRSRSVAVLPRLLREIQMRNRLDQQTEQWQCRYANRVGIEATLSQNVRAHGLDRSRCRGLTRTHVQHVLTAMACNLSRLAGGTTPPHRAAGRLASELSATQPDSRSPDTRDHQQSHGIASKP
ncbi:transposase [Streptomyces sp. IB201691-2A2]|uniref:transposase n=1 Tax=Streptomyces sp. IB201691-2A2 TaxID=2561920 RepID=UPI00117D98CD|nr:hypothetical protein E4K73_45255 [Streptomyces sp. IB201691-2A2]